MKIDYSKSWILQKATAIIFLLFLVYQNNARVHFNNHIEKDGRFGKRIIYGGYIISLARAISCNGLANAFKILAIHSGRHAAPTFSGDTIYAWSKILKKNKINESLGALLIRTIKKTTIFIKKVSNIETK